MPDTQRGFNINVFRAEFMSRDIARPNLFIAEFAVPPGLSANGNTTYYNTVRRLEYWIEATALPGVTIRTYNAQRYGYGNEEARPLLNVFTQVQFNVIFDRQHLNYDFFSQWMNLIINRDLSQGTVGTQGPSGSLPNELEYRDNYVADVSIYLYDQMGNIIKQIALREAFPIVLGDVALAWADNNNFLKLPVTMQFNDWYEPQNINTTPPALPSAGLPT